MKDWTNDALCGKVAQEQPEMANAWIAENSERSLEAKQVCEQCTVRRECALAALMYERQTWGMRGGFYFRGGTLQPRDAREFMKEFHVRPPARAKIFHANSD